MHALNVFKVGAPVHAGKLFHNGIILLEEKQEAQLMLTTGSTRLADSRGQQIWYHSTCNI